MMVSRPKAERSAAAPRDGNEGEASAVAVQDRRAPPPLAQQQQQQQQSRHAGPRQVPVAGVKGQQSSMGQSGTFSGGAGRFHSAGGGSGGSEESRSPAAVPSVADGAVEDVPLVPSQGVEQQQHQPQRQLHQAPKQQNQQQQLPIRMVTDSALLPRGLESSMGGAVEVNDPAVVVRLKEPVGGGSGNVTASNQNTVSGQNSGGVGTVSGGMPAVSTTTTVTTKGGWGDASGYDYDGAGWGDDDDDY